MEGRERWKGGRGGREGEVHYIAVPVYFFDSEIYIRSTPM